VVVDVGPGIAQRRQAFVAGVEVSRQDFDGAVG
jgi:hypothetical protein